MQYNKLKSIKFSQQDKKPLQKKKDPPQKKESARNKRVKNGLEKKPFKLPRMA
jgi:hypothetical protein